MAISCGTLLPLKRMAKNRELPSSLFQVISSLLPHIIEVFRKCDLTPTELFILSQIKHSGKDYNGQRVFLGKHMNDILKELFRYSASQASKEINSMANRGFIRWAQLTPDERESLYGDRKGKKWILVLLSEGSGKINEFTGELNKLYQAATARVPGIILTPFSRALDPLTREIIKSLQLHGR